MTLSLVTGGAGFIGAHVVNALIGSGHRVVVVDDLSGGFRDNVHPAAVFMEGSVSDHALLERLFNEHDFDYVYHLAAYAAEGLSHFIRRFNYTSNLIGSVNVINESVKHKVKCFVFTSSIAVYGALPPPMREDMAPTPKDPYGIAKLAVEQDLRAAHDMFGLNYIIFRPHNVYGEYQNIGDRYRNVVGIFMNQIMQHKPLTVFGDGLQTRAFSYIGDVAPVIAGSVTKPEAYNRTFNVGADTDYTVKELAEMTMKAMGAKGSIRFLPPRDEVRHAQADHERARTCFGAGVVTSLESGLARMASWARRAGIRKSRRFEAIEISHNLPPIWTEDE